MRLGDIIGGRYVLRERIGKGGMAEVWSARHRLTRRPFAVKIVAAQFGSDPEWRARFLREARASAEIGHPSIVDIFDVGEMENGDLYLVMELLEGGTLADALDGNPPLTSRELIGVMADVCEALAAAHRAGIVHRDVKHANIFVHRDRRGSLHGKLVDFGISKLMAPDDDLRTRAGVIFGTPRFMSPEQVSNSAAAGPPADVWAVGVVLFNSFTRSWPHEAEGVHGRMLAIQSKPPASLDAVAPHLPAELRAIVGDCLLPLDRRAACASELAYRLRGLLQSLGHDLLASPPCPPRAQGEPGGSGVAADGAGNLAPAQVQTVVSTPSAEELARAAHAGIPPELVAAASRTEPSGTERALGTTQARWPAAEQRAAVIGAVAAAMSALTVSVIFAVLWLNQEDDRAPVTAAPVTASGNDEPTTTAPEISSATPVTSAPSAPASASASAPTTAATPPATAARSGRPVPTKPAPTEKGIGGKIHSLGSGL